MLVGLFSVRAQPGRGHGSRRLRPRLGEVIEFAVETFLVEASRGSFAQRNSWLSRSSGRTPRGMEQRETRQRVGIDAVGLRVARQEPTQMSGLHRAHPIHEMTANDEHRGRQPRRPRRFNHHLNRVPADVPVSTSVKLRIVGSSPIESPSPLSTRTECADAMPKSMPTRRLSFIFLLFSSGSSVAHRLARTEAPRFKATVPRETRPTVPLMCCERVLPPRADSRPSSGHPWPDRHDDQIDEARPQRLPQCGSQRRHPNQPDDPATPGTVGPDVDPDPAMRLHVRGSVGCVINRPARLVPTIGDDVTAFGE